MAKNEVEELLRTALAPLGQALREDVSRPAQQRRAEASTSEAAGSDAAALLAAVGRLAAPMSAQASSLEESARVLSRVAARPADSGGGSSVLGTLGRTSGVGWLVAGLRGLFGSEPEKAPELPRFAMPRPVRVEAGLEASRRFAPVSYAQGGAPRAVAPAPQIQVTVQALDSQSFLDRKDDIARAVREAMLHSHALNDVVMEL